MCALVVVNGMAQNTRDIEGTMPYIMLAQDGLVCIDSSGRVQTYDVKDPKNITRKLSTTNGPYICRFDRLETELYVAARNQGIIIFKMKDPRPTVIDLKGDALDVKVVNNIAYIAYGKKGVQIYDVKDANAPVKLGEYDCQGVACAVYKYCQYLFVAAQDKGLKILDVSNPAQPVCVSTYENGVIWDVCVAGGGAYVACGKNGLAILNVFRIDSPKYIKSYA